MSARPRFLPWFRTPGERYERACAAERRAGHERLAALCGVSVETVERWQQANVERWVLAPEVLAPDWPEVPEP